MNEDTDYRWTGEWGKRILNILESKTSINSETGCWEWQGYINPSGHGRVVIDGKRDYVHRLSAMLFLGYRPEFIHLQVNHKSECKSKNCWNHDHLYVGTQTENMQDKSNNITHCPAGHEYTPENLGISSNSGKRYCKECNRIRAREFTAKKKGLIDFKKEVG